MKKAYKIFLGLSCIIALFILGCQKKETVQVDNETQSSVDNAVADQEYMSIVPAVNGHAINTKGTGAVNGRTMSAPCDSLTWINRTTSDTTYANQLANPIFTMNISNANCPLTFPDGRFRTGQLQIRLTGRIKKPGSQMIIKMINYNVVLPVATGAATANVTYSCDSIVVTTLDSSALYTKFNVKLINGLCTWGSGKVIKYSSDRTITNYSKGNPINSDPVAEISGSANGVDRDGRAFTVNIPSGSPIVKHKSCEWIDKGVLQLTPDGFKTRTVDFGNGTCDDKATFTVNGSTVAFTLN